MPKASKPTSGQEDDPPNLNPDPDWVKVDRRRGSKDKNKTKDKGKTASKSRDRERDRSRDSDRDRNRDRDRHRSKESATNSPKGSSLTKQSPDESESPSRTTSLGGKRNWASDSDSDGQTDPKRTPTHNREPPRRHTPPPKPPSTAAKRDQGKSISTSLSTSQSKSSKSAPEAAVAAELAAAEAHAAAKGGVPPLRDDLTDSVNTGLSSNPLTPCPRGASAEALDAAAAAAPGAAGKKSHTKLTKMSATSATKTNHGQGATVGGGSILTPPGQDRGGWPLPGASARGRGQPPNNSALASGSEKVTSSVSGTRRPDHHPALQFTYANAAKKMKIDFKVPLPIPEWKDLELRIYKTNQKQVPLSHKEFNSVREKLYKYILYHLKNNPEPETAHHTEATHNHWSAALQCGVWECSNKDSLTWYREAVGKATNQEFRGWVKNERSTHLIKILPHESFNSFSAAEYLQSIHFYHQDLHIPSWKLLHEYHQSKGARILVVEVQSRYLEAAKCKATTPDAGIWRLQGMGMPMKFTMATPADIQKAPAHGQPVLLTTVSRPPTPHTPVRTLTGTPSRAQPGGSATVTRPAPKVSQPGSTTPITSAMSGFTLASPLHRTTPSQHPQVPIQYPPSVDSSQGTYYAVHDPNTNTITPIPSPYYQPYNPPYQMVGHYQQQPQYSYQQAPLAPPSDPSDGKPNLSTSTAFTIPNPAGATTITSGSNSL